MSEEAAAGAAAAAQATDQRPPPDAAEKDPLSGLQNCASISEGDAKNLWVCSSFCGRPCIIKKTSDKAYRHPILERKMSGSRLKQEVKSMARLRKLGLLVPALYYVDADSSCIYMEKIAGKSLKQLLLDSSQEEAATAALLSELGRVLAVMHDAGCVHGDLKTSNIMVRDDDQAVALLDFSLSLSSTYPEDKGVDLVLLEQDMTASHPDHKGLFDKIMDSYKKHSKQWSATFNKFAEVRSGRRSASKKAT